MFPTKYRWLAPEQRHSKGSEDTYLYSQSLITVSVLNFYYFCKLDTSTQIMNFLMNLTLVSSLFKNVAAAYEGRASSSQSPVFQINRP